MFNKCKWLELQIFSSNKLVDTLYECAIFLGEILIQVSLLFYTEFQPPMLPTSCLRFCGGSRVAHDMWCVILL